MEITIRPALETEANMLTTIAFASKRYWQYPKEWIELWFDELTVSRGYIRSHQVFCAVIKNKVVGWYALRFLEEDCELDYFWVLPEVMGHGVGSAMMQHAKDFLLKSQHKTMTVISDPHAEGFYVKMGFEKIGMHPSKPKGRHIPILAFVKRRL